MLDDVDHWGLALVLLVLSHLLVANQAPELVNVDDGANLTMLDDVEVPHTNLSEETRMVLVPHDPVVMLASCITATTWMLPVLSNTTVTGTDLATVMAVLLEAGCHRVLPLFAWCP